MAEDKYNDGQLFNFIKASDSTGESVYDIWKSLGNTGGGADFLEFLRSANAT